MKVSEILRLFQADGWSLTATRRSHRQFKHASNPSRVTVPGKPIDDVASGTLNSIHKHAGLKSRGPMRYAIVIKKAEGNFYAKVPDLPRCVATGATVAEVEAEIREAIIFHVDGLLEDELPIPNAVSRFEYIEVAA